MYILNFSIFKPEMAFVHGMYVHICVSPGY